MVVLLEASNDGPLASGIQQSADGRSGLSEVVLFGTLVELDRYFRFREIVGTARQARASPTLFAWRSSRVVRADSISVEIRPARACGVSGAADARFDGRAELAVLAEIS
jgi:hypothetical protein